MHIIIESILATVIVLQFILLLVKQNELKNCKIEMKEQLAFYKERKRQAILVIRRRQTERHQ